MSFLFNNLRKIYLKLKLLPIVGPLSLWLRSFIYQPRWQKIVLKFKDSQAAYRILIKIYPFKKNEIKKYLKLIKKSAIFKQKFSYGHSGNFDILILYVLVRLLKPQIVVETGVASGRSSTVILQALHDNKFGQLYSIDLPLYYEKDPANYLTSDGHQELSGFIPVGQQPGWLVPDYLRSRWQLILGSSQEKLPQLIKQLDHIDIFYHDSEHSYKNMTFEFNLTWPLISTTGFLLSDDIYWNKSFIDFIEQKQIINHFSYRNFGIIYKK